MKTKTLTALAGCAILLTACFPSVNPFYTETDLVTDPKLPGEWREKDKTNSVVWRFEIADEKSYKLSITEEDGKQGEFEARLLKLKDERFLDLTPSKLDYATNQAVLVAAAMIPGHLLVRVSQIEPELKLALFDNDWVEKYLEANPKAVAHQVRDHTVIFTAETVALQKFVLAHLGEGELFAKSETMVRKPLVSEKP